MVREVKLGLLAIIVTAMMIWGYQYVKGKNLFKNVKTFHAIFENIDQLNVAAPVIINGYEIGNVSRIQLNPKNVKSILVSIEVDGKIDYPKNTRVILADAGLVGGKIVALEFDGLCTGEDCAKSNDTLQTEILGFMESLIGKDNLDGYMGDIKAGAAGVFDTLSAKLSNKDSDSPLNQAIWDMQETMSNLSEVTSTLNIFMRRSYQNMDTMIANLTTITGTLANNNQQITSIMSNFDSITMQLKEADLGNTLSSATGAIDTATQVFAEMRNTLTEANEAFTQLSEVMEKVESGEGTLSKLLNDKTMYTNLEKTSRNMALLLQDLRLNPRRYVSLSVFGKKAKEYTKPEDDPADQDDKNEPQN